MKRPDLPYLISRHKGRYWYFQRGGSKAPMTRLPDPGEPGFLEAYTEARKGRPRPTRTSIAALADSYVASSRWLNLAPRSKADYRKALDHIRGVAGTLDVSAITRPGLIAMLEENRHRARFANYLVQVYSVLCEHAIDIGWLRENPAKGVKLLPLGSGWDAWPRKALDAYLEHAKDEALWIWGLAYWTGQRIGDVLKMRWDEIGADGDGAEGITLLQNKGLRKGKKPEPIWIPILPGLRTLLDEIPRRGFTIVARKDSRPLSYRQAAYAVEQAREASGTKACVLHGLRANAASELYESGCSDAQVQAITGHKSAVMAQRYGRGARQKKLAKDAMGKRDGRG